ncbi:MAG: TrkH family potassium uptake protein [Cyanobacteriota bacterium]|nr:TrkH family potassium uptake protein [Cyanobacteriota bacterium]
MTKFINTILRDLGLFLHVPAIMAIISAIVCIFCGEYYAIIPFIVTAIAALGIGQLLYRFCRNGEESQIRHSMITVALAWGIIPLLGSIPFILIANHVANFVDASSSILAFQNPLNSILEAFSGFTSAGLSVALKASELPQSLQWWRSFMQWVGGVGVIVLVISLLEPSTDAYQLYSAEGRKKTIGLTLKSTVRSIWWIYLLYTLASIILLRIVGMPWWDALNHGMTGISTGGFSIKDESIGSYTPAIQSAVIPIMILGAISFSVHYQLLRKGRLSALWRSNEHRFLLILLVVGTGLLLYFNYSQTKAFLWLDSIFQWASALGTCGYNTVNIKLWSQSSKLLLSLAMIVGGASGSTVGGLKLNRLLYLCKAVVWRFKRISLQPHQMMRYELEHEVIVEVEATRKIEAAAILAFLWMITLTVGIFLLLEVVTEDYNLTDVIFEAASALGSVGLSTGITHPNLHWLGKLVLIIFMWMGRLEIIPVLLLFSTVTNMILKKVLGFKF